MLSFGSAAYLADKTLVDTYSANLELLPGAEGDPRTMRWWATQPEAWAACRSALRQPGDVMPEYDAWVRRLPGKPVFVAYPAGFDFTFIYWYLMRFAGKSAFSYSALDIKTFAMAILGTRFRHTTKRIMPREWFDDLPHNHIALDDAIEQGAMFCNILAQRDRRRESLRSQDEGTGGETPDPSQPLVV